jgi:hypothetical protein
MGWRGAGGSDPEETWQPPPGLPYAPPPGYRSTASQAGGRTGSPPPPNLPGPSAAGTGAGWATSAPSYPGYPSHQGPPGYGNPGAGWGGYGQPVRDKGATKALILGIVSLLICGLVFGPAAIGEGTKARNRIRASGGALTGDGLALAGIWLGGIGLVAALGLIILRFSGI